MQLGDWSWLEIAKLATGVLTPVTLAGLGVYIHRVTKRFEHIQWRNQKLIEKRLAVYDALAPDLNDILCYFTYVGCWRDLDPPSVVALKRTVDKKMYLAAPLFSDEFFRACMRFQELCYEPFAGWGRDALLRAKFERRKEARTKDWRSDWDTYFSANVSDPKDISDAYKCVMAAFARDIEVHSDFAMPLATRISANIR